MSRYYVDSTALAKWYLPERGSEEVTALIQEHAPMSISSLTVVEMRSLLARRRREREIRPAFEAKVVAAFQGDIDQAHLACHPLSDDPVREAAMIPDRLKSVPLRTLDALHLAVARYVAAEAVLTADRVMATAARALDMRVTYIE